MQIVAIIAARNEEAYIANSLRYLIANGIYFAILDNGSTDSTMAIATGAEFHSSSVGLEQVKYAGAYNWTDILQRKMEVINRIDADWVIHLDADEIMHSYHLGEHLADAIRRIDEQGFNVINFDEFVFLPIDYDYEPDRHGPQRMRHYYFFEPFAPRLMRAWKKAAGLSMVDAGGHVLSGPHIRLAPETMALRHYIFRDQNHAFTKYAERRFGPEDLARGWHRQRANQPIENFRLPAASHLSRLSEADAREFDRTRPAKLHYWHWPKAN
ncbi:MAG TPA: glycosyltransferase family 2 protein [Candidatus Dormibacteraeota bacterium]|nr:glycosyltransferase family 2 protein [Candidatus Dormibacteraeota bacterium]